MHSNHSLIWKIQKEKRFSKQEKEKYERKRKLINELSITCSFFSIEGMELKKLFN